MLTGSKMKRTRETDAPVELDTKDAGHGISWFKIKTPNGRRRKTNDGWRKTNDGWLKHELLPGIPNEITLDLITPKLPWITFHTLPLVNSSWRQAIQSRQVYNARCRAHATETLITISAVGNLNVGDADIVGKWIGLYSMSEAKIYRLPGINNNDRTPEGCQCISLDGKVYVIGGLSSNLNSAIRSMYVLDLVASKGWKRCASMKHRRSDFGCCTIDGKIFVCGGRTNGGSPYSTTCQTIVLEPEVYVPELDRWFSLKSMTSLRVSNKVEVLGDEILVHSGFDYHDHKRGFPKFSKIMEIYNPILDEWRTVEDPMLHDRVSWRIDLFVTLGRIYSLKYPWGGPKHKWQVQVYNFDKKFWRDIPKSLLVDAPRGYVVDIATPLIRDYEIVGLVASSLIDAPTLTHSSGFNDKQKIKVWQIAPFHIAEETFDNPCRYNNGYISYGWWEYILDN